jgi:galactose mutarotase-like enzyme
MVIIENDIVRAQINPLGAELSSLFHKQFQLEYMWNGDPAVWGKHSPVLFPIVGTLKNNQYVHNAKTYEMGRHGFARERVFLEEEKNTDSVVFLLKNDEDSWKIFPFEFEFRIRYQLRKSQLNVTYEIGNTGRELLLFSVGGHPAFALPLSADTSYEDYYLEFEKAETAGRWPISQDGLIEKEPIAVLDNTHQLPLSKELFQKDALVFKALESTEISIRSDKTDRGLWLDFADFPYLGVWAAKNADFVCIEPWCGIADPVDSRQELRYKEGINKLPSGQLFSRTWVVELF